VEKEAQRQAEAAAKAMEELIAEEVNNIHIYMGVSRDWIRVFVFFGLVIATRIDDTWVWNHGILINYYHIWTSFLK